MSDTDVAEDYNRLVGEYYIGLADDNTLRSQLYTIASAKEVVDSDEWVAREARVLGLFKRFEANDDLTLENLCSETYSLEDRLVIATLILKNDADGLTQSERLDRLASIVDALYPHLQPETELEPEMSRARRFWEWLKTN